MGNTSASKMQKGLSKSKKRKMVFMEHDWKENKCIYPHLSGSVLIRIPLLLSPLLFSATVICPTTIKRLINIGFNFVMV
jgi:hypothetical protein